jgi:hypothetical protein
MESLFETGVYMHDVIIISLLCTYRENLSIRQVA